MINLVTVVGHGIDLIPHFIKHYEKYVDEIHIVLYESDLTYRLHSKVMNLIRNKPNVKIIKVVSDEPFKWSYVTYLYNKTIQTKPDEWWVIADIDEFHLYPNDDLKSMLDDCDKNEWKIVRGGFIDRVGIDGVFPKIVGDVNIFKQFPYMGFFRNSLSDACPNKICVVKGDIEISTGQHYAIINGQTTWRWQGWTHPLIAPTDKYMTQVHHFKWDETSINRMKEVVVRNGEYSEEYNKMYKALKLRGFSIDVNDKKFMFEKDKKHISFSNYKQWNKLSKKIIII